MITHNATFSSFRRLLRDERGQGLVEYALIVALVSIVAIAALKFLGGKASNTLNNAANSL
jgi:pilus assembly protein Flp/PilA